MDQFEGPSDQPRRPLLTAAACLFVLVLGYLFSCVATSEGITPSRPVSRFAPTSFPVSTPEEQGMNSVYLADAIDYLLEERDLYDIHSLTVIRHGHIVADAYFYPYQSGSMHNLASTSKVFLTTLVGIAVDKGFIGSVDDAVLDYFPDRSVANLDDRKRALTIEHLLTMTSGLGLVDDDDTDGMEESADWVQYALDLPMSHDPGTWWNYHQPTAFLLSALLTEATGMNALEFAREHLFDAMGIVDSHWTASPTGVNNGYNDLKLRPHDIAKLGQLFLQQGTWEGERLLSTAWIDAATSILVGDHYGYMWNHYSDFPECYQGAGALGQRLVVSPSRDLVVVFTGGGFAHEDIERIYLEALDSYIFPAVVSDEPLPAYPDGETSLRTAVALAASTDLEPHPVRPLPTLAATISDTTYAIDPNPYGISSISLWFPASDEARVRVGSNGTATMDNDFVWAAGLDGIERCSRAMLGIPACGVAHWLDETVFEMTVNALGMFVRVRLTFVLEEDGNRLSLVVEDLDWWDPGDPVTLTGSRDPSLSDQTPQILRGTKRSSDTRQ